MKVHEYPFERLDVWKKAVGLAKVVYDISAKFPTFERYGLADQVRRASVSVSSNIAEGSGCVSLKNQMRYYEIACASLMEVCSQLVLAVEFGYLSREENDKQKELINEISYKLNALRSSCIKRISPAEGK